MKKKKKKKKKKKGEKREYLLHPQIDFLNFNFADSTQPAV